MQVDIVNVEHGACAFIVPPVGTRFAMVDCGHNSSTGWRPSTHIASVLKRTALDYLFITNADNDHYSDLANLAQSVQIHWFYRNRKFSPDQFVQVKRASGPLTADALAYNQLDKSHVYGFAAVPDFDSGMGGITQKMFCNAYGAFADTNNLSMAVFFHYSGFQILFPGDLHEAGWKQLLENPAFVTELQKTTILVASHHGRADGFCAEVFDHCKPQAIVISDKPIAHETQEGMASVYGAMVAEDGVKVRGSAELRKVLTTRSDGMIRFDVRASEYFVETTG